MKDAKIYGRNRGEEVIMLPGQSTVNFLVLVVRTVMLVLMALFIPLTILSFTTGFKYLSDKLFPIKIKKYANGFVFGGISILLVIGSTVIGGYNQVNFASAGNKSYARTDSYVLEDNTGNNIFHLSFDDTIQVFEDINKNKYESIFENSTFGWYRDLHESYGVVISCYVYYEDGDFNLSKFPSRYKDEFIQNSSWLRFGFHTINGDTNYQSGNITSDYLKTVKEIERIAGSESIDNVVRLQMFQGSYNEIKELTELEDQPVKGFLTADDNRQSYYLSEDENTYIYNHDEYYDNLTDLYFFSTDFRTEYVTDINAKLKELKSNCWYNQTGDLVVFSHEWALSLENKEKIEKVCNYAKNEGYRFEFFEDIILHSN